jgi:hypothetical protein
MYVVSLVDEISASKLYRVRKIIFLKTSENEFKSTIFPSMQNFQHKNSLVDFPSKIFSSAL